MASRTAGSGTAAGTLGRGGTGCVAPEMSERSTGGEIAAGAAAGSSTGSSSHIMA